MINFKSDCKKCQQYRNGCDILERIKRFSDDASDQIASDIFCLKFKKLENPCPSCSHEKVCQFKNSDDGDCLYYEKKSLQKESLCDSCYYNVCCHLKHHVAKNGCASYVKGGWII